MANTLFSMQKGKFGKLLSERSERVLALPKGRCSGYGDIACADEKLLVRMERNRSSRCRNLQHPRPCMAYHLARQMELAPAHGGYLFAPPIHVQGGMLEQDEQVVRDDADAEEGVSLSFLNV